MVMYIAAFEIVCTQLNRSYHNTDLYLTELGYFTNTRPPFIGPLAAILH